MRYLIIILLLFSPCTIKANSIVTFGDSITAGFNVTGDCMPNGRTDLEGATSSHIQDIMSEFTVYNYGICGEQTNEGVLRFKSILLSIPDVKYVFILEGINDFMNLKSFNEAVSNVISMVRIAQSIGITPIVATLTPWPGAEGYILPYNKMIMSAGKEYNFQIVDMYSNLVDNWLSQYIDEGDALHPNAKGYKKMAEIWIENIFPENFCRFNNKYWYRDKCHNIPPPMPGVYLLLLK